MRTSKRADFLAGILTTAVEGGVNHWATIEDYRWYFPDLEGGTAAPGPDNSANAYAVLVESEQLESDGDDADRQVVTLDTIATGLAILRTEIGAADRLVGADAVTRLMIADLSDGQSGDYDSVVADLVLQCGLFGGGRYA